MTEVISDLESLGDFPEASDAAWASINTPLSPEDLLDFCLGDIERLFRINPYLEFEDWKNLGDNRFACSGKNNSQDQPFRFDLKLDVEELTDGLRVRYTGGVKLDTLFKIERSAFGSKLIIQEQYLSLDPEQMQLKLAEVDRSLTTWVGDIQKYLVMWKQWRWFAPWRWYMRMVWKPMKPAGRRITYMFWWITLVEILLIMLGVTIYWVEYH